MRFATYRIGDEVAYGRVFEGEVGRLGPGVADAPPSLLAALAAGPDGLKAAAAASEKAERLSLDAVRLLAPVPTPRKYLGLGGNYESHMAEAAHLGLPRPAGQVWFNKQVSCISGPYDDIHLPRVSPTLDYEGELGVVIGARGRHVRRDRAHEIIAGYVVCNDVSVREWQARSPTHTLGKSFDTHGPFGPYLVTADEIDDPYGLLLTTHVNGELRQSTRTGEMIFKFGEQIEELTTAITLEPGDILSTGSPAGVGGLMRPPCFLKAGDTVRVEISGLGHIENRVIDEPAPAEAGA